MGRPKNSKKSQRSNISKTATHKCCGTANDRALEEVKESKNDSKNIEKERVWIDNNDEWIEVLKKKAGAPAATLHQSSFLMARRRTTTTHLINFVLTCSFPKASPIGINLLPK